jgi:hypothetical protein
VKAAKTVEEVQKDIGTLEQFIYGLIQDFQSRNGVCVSDIETRTIEVTTHGGRQVNVISGVHVCVTL